jgi:hypothetical protein
MDPRRKWVVLSYDQLGPKVTSKIYEDSQVPSNFHKIWIEEIPCEN